MEKSNRVYKVPKCPLCKKMHKYRLKVIQSPFLYGASEPASPLEKSVRMLFICPKKGMKYEGTVTLPDDPKNKIVSITNEGLIEEKK